MDAPHPLFEAVRVPGDVVVEENVAALEVDSFSGRLGSDQDLYLPFAELLLGVEPGTRFVAGAGFHGPVDAADAEAPGFQLFHQVVEGVLELGEQQQPLVGPVEEPLLLHDPPKMSELRLAARAFDCFRLPGKLQQLGDLFPHLPGVAGQGDRFQHPFQALALRVLELLELFQTGKIRGRGSNHFLGPA